MPRRTDSRQRMLAAAQTLFAQKGYLATTLDDIVAASGTPRGSVYFHFPGGKEQIAIETAGAVSVSMPELVRDLNRASASPADLVRRFFAQFADLFVESGHRQGCPIATTTLEIDGSAPLLAHLDNVFEQWRGAFAAVLEEVGTPSSEAAAIAAVILSGFEGALIQAKAARDCQIIRTVGEELATYVEHRHRALPSRSEG
jgi:TetR/AcrR family transcriptional repressor of lmrAB and yxaGH operons